MPAVLVWLGSLLATVAGELAVRALIGVGIGFATYTVAIDPAKAWITNTLNGAGPLVGYIGWFGLDKAMTIVLSAWAGRIATDSAKAYLVKRKS